MSQQYRYPQSASVTVAAVGTNGAAIPTSSILVAGNKSGNLAPVLINGSGELLVSADVTGTSDVNIIQILGVAPSATNALPARLTDGSAYYAAPAAAQLPASLGQAAMAASLAVAIASDQSTLPVSAASLPLPSGAATEATLSAFSAKSAGTDVPAAYDYRAFTYVGATNDIATITYKTGGSGGTTVATQTFGYDGSNRLTSITTT